MKALGQPSGSYRDPARMIDGAGKRIECGAELEGLKISPRDRAARIRLWLLVATGLALPFYAFPALGLAGRQIDLATIMAALFAVASLPSLVSRRYSASTWLWISASAAAPLLVLIAPVLPRFTWGTFAVSYLHWMLLVSFFFLASSLELSERERRGLLLANVAMGSAVALFAFYQMIGIPRGWPGTGATLVSFQRAPLRLTDMGNGYVRPSSVFLEPAWMGGYLSWVLALAIALFAAGRRRGQQFFGLLGVVLALLAIGASVSWGAYADAAAALIVSAAAQLRSRGLSARGVLAAAGVLLVLVLLAGVAPSGRQALSAAKSRFAWLLQTPVTPTQMTSEVMDSSWVRFRNLAHTAALFRSRIKRGIGVGQFANYANSGGAPKFRDPWCGWLAIAAEMGLLGPLLLLGAIFLALGRWWRTRNPSREPFGSGTPALVAVCVVMQVHTASYIDLWFWYPLSLALVLATPPARGLPHG